MTLTELEAKELEAKERSEQRAGREWSKLLRLEEKAKAQEAVWLSAYVQAKRCRLAAMGRDERGRFRA